MGSGVVRLAVDARLIVCGSGEEECVVGVEQWAEIRRLVLVERRSQRQVARSLGLARDTVARALASDAPPRYERSPVVSKLDPFREWICEQLAADPSIPSLRLRELATELGYEGGKSTFDDYVREVRPRFQVRRTFQRTIYRPGELVQCDLWEPGGADLGRSRAAAPRVCGDGGVVLVAGDRRRVDLL